MNADDIKRLPAWATVQDGSNVIEIDPAVAYPVYLEKLNAAILIRMDEVPGEEGEEPKPLPVTHDDLPLLKQDKYGAEVIRRCVVNDAIALAGADIVVRLLKAPKWKLADLHGDPADEQRGANDFRKYWDKLRDQRAKAAMVQGL